MDNIDTEELINDLINSDTEHINLNNYSENSENSENTNNSVNNNEDINIRNIQHSSSFNSNESEEKSSDDLTNSLISINNDEEHNILNNYKYSENIDDNIDITVEHFMKLLNIYPEISTMMNNVKTDIKNLPDLMSFLKEKDHKLTLNIMDYPQNCFDKIFDLIKNINNENYEDEIKFIKDIVPFFNDDKIKEALHICNKDTELAINYLYENN